VKKVAQESKRRSIDTSILPSIHPPTTTMGNAPISIGLRTDQTSYTAGDTVTGRVYVLITKEAQPVQALVLQLRGEEHAVVNNTTGDDRRRNRREFTFLRMEYPLHTYNSDQQQQQHQQHFLPVGQYEYPFSIHLPAGCDAVYNLPSSMHCQSDYFAESYCEVKYELIVTLQQPSSGLFHSNPQSRQSMTIYAASPPATILHLLLGQEPEQEDTTTCSSSALQLPLEHVPVHNYCGCLRQGSMALEAQLTERILQPHDAVHVQFSCRNQSTATVHTVRVQLEQIVEWKGRNRYRETRKRVLDCTDMGAAQFPELTKLQRRPPRNVPPPYYYYEEQQYPDHPEQYHDHHHHPHDHHDPEQTVPMHQEQQQAASSNTTTTTTTNCWHSSSVQVPPIAYDSYRGRAVQVRHVLSVQLLTNGLFTTNPESSALIQIFRSVPKVTVATASAVVLDQQPLPCSSYGSCTTSTSTSSTSSSTPMAQAQLLPPDWHAQTAEVVDIPMAQVTILEPGVQMT
jgi:hypothetical protein